jgi:protein OS-9
VVVDVRASLLTNIQYEVLWPDTFITENDAISLLSHGSPSASSAIPGSQETQELSKRDKPAADIPTVEDALEHTYEAVVLHGQRYLCSIPVIPEDTPQNSTTSAEEAKAEEEKELMRATDRGWELLEGMRGNCIYYLSGWWSYSFCYKDEVKQFHQLPPGRGVPIYPPVEDTSVHSFVLGRFSKEEKSKKADARKTLGSEQGSKEVYDDEGNISDEEDTKGLELPRLESKGSNRYMVQRLSDGTECDLTGRPRKIDVQVCIRVSTTGCYKILTCPVSLQPPICRPHCHDQGNKHLLLPHDHRHAPPLPRRRLHPTPGKSRSPNNLPSRYPRV